MLVIQPLKLYEFLTLLISIVGFIGVIYTLKIYVRQAQEMARQSNYLAESLHKNIFQGVESQKMAVAQVFVLEPNLRCYFYGRQDINSQHPLYPRVVAVAELMLNFFDVVVNLSEYLSIWPNSGLYAHMKESFADSPILCKHLQNMKNKITSYDELVELMKSGLELRPTSVPSQPTSIILSSTIGDS